MGQVTDGGGGASEKEGWFEGFGGDRYKNKDPVEGLYLAIFRCFVNCNSLRVVGLRKSTCF